MQQGRHCHGVHAHVIMRYLHVSRPVILQVAHHGEEDRGEEQDKLRHAIPRVGAVYGREADVGQGNAKGFEQKVWDEASKTDEGVDKAAVDLQKEVDRQVERRSGRAQVRSRAG